jgi:DNA-binding CsgD family transcriptional regulator
MAAHSREPAGLTPRELEVLELVAEGLRNAQIAQRLVVSEKTVHHHVSAILRKLGVRTRGEASATAGWGLLHDRLAQGRSSGWQRAVLGPYRPGEAPPGTVGWVTLA